MELKNEMKYFEAVTYDEQIYHFAVTPEGEITCAEFKCVEPVQLIEIKPNFVLRASSGRTIYSLDDYYRDNGKKKTNEKIPA